MREMSRSKSADANLSLNQPNEVRRKRSDLGSSKNHILEYKKSVLEEIYQRRDFLLNFKATCNIFRKLERSEFDHMKTLLEQTHKKDIIKLNDEHSNKEDINKSNTNQIDYTNIFINYMNKSNKSSEKTIISKEKEGEIMNEWRVLGKRASLSQQDRRYTLDQGEKIRITALYYREMARSCGKEMKNSEWNNFVNEAVTDLGNLQVADDDIRDNMTRWKNINDNVTSDLPEERERKNKEILEQELKIKAFYKGHEEQ